jgi:pimeloyl-ACP methyl ester carboxylesterase
VTLWTQRTGAGDGAPLLLLHGMGATAEVFRGVADRAGRPCVLVDLPGHGRSPWSAPYDLGQLCSAVAGAVPELADAVVVGHSLGGVIALALASGAVGAVPPAAVAVSVKALWSDDDLARAAAQAVKPRSRFATADEAEERFLKVAGLWGVDDRPELRRSGVVHDGDAWLLAQDPETNAFVPPDVRVLLQAARCPVRIATGGDDRMAPPAMLAEVAPDGTVVPGVGHNLHVEAPEALLDLVRDVTAR